AARIVGALDRARLPPGRRRRESADDLARRLDPIARRHALPRLPVVLLPRLVQRGALELPQRAEGIDGAHQVLGAPVTEHPAGGWTGAEPDALDVRRADDGHGDAGDALAQDDVVLAGREDGPL